MNTALVWLSLCCASFRLHHCLSPYGTVKSISNINIFSCLIIPKQTVLSLRKWLACFFYLDKAAISAFFSLDF